MNKPFIFLKTRLNRTSQNLPKLYNKKTQKNII